jgi:hypothetical protein
MNFLFAVSFPFDPLSDVRRAIQQFDSALFAFTEIAHYPNIHECQFIEIERHVRPCCEGLRLEVLEVLGMNLSDQLQNCSTSLRVLLNPQRHVLKLMRRLNAHDQPIAKQLKINGLC